MVIILAGGMETFITGGARVMVLAGGIVTFIASGALVE